MTTLNRGFKKACDARIQLLIETNLNESHGASQSERLRKLHEYMAARRFLQSLSELSDLLDDTSGAQCNLILEKMHYMLITSDKVQKDAYRDDLVVRWNLLNEILDEKKTLNFFVALSNALWNAIGTALSVATVLIGMELYLNGLGLGLGLFAATAMGPVGMIALGLGILICGAIAGVVYANRTHKDVRFCMGSQVKEMNEYIDFLKPQAEMDIKMGVSVQEQKGPPAYYSAENSYSFMSTLQQPPQTTPMYPSSGYYSANFTGKPS